MCVLGDGKEGGVRGREGDGREGAYGGGSGRMLEAPTRPDWGGGGLTQDFKFIGFELKQYKKSWEKWCRQNLRIWA